MNVYVCGYVYACVYVCVSIHVCVLMLRSLLHFVVSILDLGSQPMM